MQVKYLPGPVAVSNKSITRFVPVMENLESHGISFFYFQVMKFNFSGVHTATHQSWLRIHVYGAN